MKCFFLVFMLSFSLINAEDLSLVHLMVKSCSSKDENCNKLCTNIKKLGVIPESIFYTDSYISLIDELSRCNYLERNENLPKNIRSVIKNCSNNNSNHDVQSLLKEKRFYNCFIFGADQRDVRKSCSKESPYNRDLEYVLKNKFKEGKIEISKFENVFKKEENDEVFSSCINNSLKKSCSVLDGEKGKYNGPHNLDTGQATLNCSTSSPQAGELQSEKEAFIRI